MTETMKANTRSPRGFKRCHENFVAVLEPKQVIECVKRWFDGGSLPEQQLLAIKEIAAHAEHLAPTSARLKRLIAPERVEYSAAHESAMEWIFGLDCDDPEHQWLNAVARAYDTAWHFADLWADQRDQLEDIGRLQSENWYNRAKAELLTAKRAADAIDSLSYTDTTEFADMAHAGFASIERLHRKAKAFNPRRLRQPLKARSPRQFLLLRLAEVYAFSLQRPTPLHESEKYDSASQLVDQPFVDFLRETLRLLNFPDPEATLDRPLRKLRQDIHLIDLNGLSGTRLNAHGRQATAFCGYANLNSVAWLADYDWDPELERGHHAYLW